MKLTTQIRLSKAVIIASTLVLTAVPFWVQFSGLPPEDVAFVGFAVYIAIALTLLESIHTFQYLLKVRAERDRAQFSNVHVLRPGTK